MIQKFFLLLYVALMSSTVSFAQIRTGKIEINQRLWGTISGNVSNPTYSGLTPVHLADYKLKVYQVRNEYINGLATGYIIKEDEVADVVISIKKITADSFYYSATHMPFGKSLMVMFEYGSPEKMQQARARAAKEAKYIMRGASFWCGKCKTNGYINVIKRANPDVLDEISLYKYEAQAPPK